MSEIVVIAVLLLFALGVAIAAGLVRRTSWRGAAVMLGSGGAIASAALIATALANREPARPLPSPDLPLVATDEHYRSSDTCRTCHPREYATWHRSYHRTMTQRATPETVIGDFDDARVEYDGSRYALFRRGDDFFARIDARNPRDPSAPTSRSLVHLEQTTGSHHMQIYWYATGRGRSLAAFPLVYLVEDQRWIPRRAAFLTAPGPALQDLGNWNGVCISCHTTNPSPRIRDSRRRRSDSQVAELGIACEACHGPGGEHVDANRSPVRRYGLHLFGLDDPTIVDPRDLSHVRSSQVCGQCHVIKTVFSPEDFESWMENGSSFRPGDDLAKAVQIISNETRSAPAVQALSESTPDFFRSTFWGDGTARVSGREYNGLLESPCYQRGEMACTSCHTMHQSRDDPRETSEWANDLLAPGMDGNAACLQCHEGFQGDEALTRHTNHDAGSSGSECQNCHMPYTTYGLLKAIRSHQIDSPAVASDIDHGRPNACNLCHLDRSLGWTGEHLSRWYDQPLPELTRDQARIAAGVRWSLEGDAGLRAIAGWAMGWRPAQHASGTSWLVPYLAELMNDSYDAVRAIAYRSMRTLPEFEGVARVEGVGYDVLHEPERRTEAVHAIRSRWSASAYPAPNDRRSARTLFGEDGRLLASEFARLLERRDDRPVTLAE